MRYGVCAGDRTENIKISAEAGFDYIESGFQFFANADEKRLFEYYDALNKYGIRCEAANCFMPGSLRVTCDTANRNDIADFVERGMKNGARAGLKTVVFGSSGARSVKEGFGFRKACLQLADFLGNIVSPIAENYGITVVLEPLSRNETNIINTLNEAAMLSAFVGKDNIKVLADLYHMMNVGDTFETLKSLVGAVSHSHISYPVGTNGKKRTYPKDVSEFDYKGFASAAELAGCKTCSIEADCFDFEKEAPIACAVLKSL